MRIAQVTYSYKPVVGGADVYARLLHETFTARGWESVVWQAPREGAEGDEVRILPEIPGCGRLPTFWRAARGVRLILEQLAAFDVVIAHYANYHLPLAGHPCAILLSHGVWWDDRPGDPRSLWKREVTRRAFRRAAAVVANDTFFLREMGLWAPAAQHAHAETSPGCWYVPNGVDTERFAPAERPRGSGPPVVLVPRNLYRNRGVHLAIGALAHVADRSVTMEVVGADGQAGYAEECRRLVERLGLSNRVRFRGSIAWDDMPEVYRASDVTLIPTLCGEGTSLSALESMACGVPCVGTAVAGLLDLPLVHASPEPHALASALERVLRDPAGIAERQRAAVLREFTLERWRESWLRIVEGAVGGSLA